MKHHLVHQPHLKQICHSKLKWQILKGKGGRLGLPPAFRKGDEMDVITLKNTEFPAGFKANVDHEKCIALLEHLVTEPIKKMKVIVKHMATTLRDGHVSFDFHMETIGGQFDGLQILEPFTIKTELDLKAWLQQMSCLGCRVWNWGYGKKLNYLEGWDVASGHLLKSKLVAFQVPDGFVMFMAENVLWTATCSECGRSSPDMWQSKDLEQWLDDRKWIAFPDGQQVLHYCRKCTKRILKF